MKSTTPTKIKKKIHFDVEISRLDIDIKKLHEQISLRQ